MERISFNNSRYKDVLSYIAPFITKIPLSQEQTNLDEIFDLVLILSHNFQKTKDQKFIEESYSLNLLLF
jgi:hypothetical protein